MLSTAFPSGAGKLPRPPRIRSTAPPRLEIFTCGVYDGEKVIRTVRLSVRVQKALPRLPPPMSRKLLQWTREVEEEGLETTRKRPGYHDEPLRGDLQGKRSTRLSRGWRAISGVDKRSDTVEVVFVEEVHHHDY